MSVTAEGNRGPAMDVVLTGQERVELRLALETCIKELHTEIAHTDRFEFRQELKARRALLKGVLDRISDAPPAAG